VKYAAAGYRVFEDEAAHRPARAARADAAEAKAEARIGVLVHPHQAVEHGLAVRVRHLEAFVPGLTVTGAAHDLEDRGAVAPAATSRVIAYVARSRMTV